MAQPWITSSCSVGPDRPEPTKSSSSGFLDGWFAGVFCRVRSQNCLAFDEKSPRIKKSKFPSRVPKKRFFDLGLHDLHAYRRLPAIRFLLVHVYAKFLNLESKPLGSICFLDLESWMSWMLNLGTKCLFVVSVFLLKFPKHCGHTEGVLTVRVKRGPCRSRWGRGRAAFFL